MIDFFPHRQHELAVELYFFGDIALAFGDAVRPLAARAVRRDFFYREAA
jgi:hypothetical protein